MDKNFYALGLMSGTSMDGIDASIISSNGIDDFEIMQNKYYKYDDKFINKFTPTPINIEKKNKGIKVFLCGILNLQKGIKIINTIPIRNEDIKIGGTEVFKAILPTGYALPNKNIIKIINK